MADNYNPQNDQIGTLLQIKIQENFHNEHTRNTKILLRKRLFAR